MVEVHWTLSKIMEYPEVKPLIELYKEEMRANGWPAQWKNSDHFYAMILWDGPDPISFICHAPLENTKHIHITGAWTKPEYRNRGIYTNLFSLFIKHYASQGHFTTIWSGYHPNNVVSAHIQKSRGAEINEVRENAIRTCYILPTNIEPMSNADLEIFLDLIDPPKVEEPLPPPVSRFTKLINKFRRKV